MRRRIIFILCILTGMFSFAFFHFEEVAFSLDKSRNQEEHLKKSDERNEERKKGNNKELKGNNMNAEEDATKITYSFAEWQNEIKRLRPFQLNEYFERCFESEKPYVGQINFLSAVMDRFLEFGYIHHPDLSNEGRKVFIEMGNTVADMIRNVYKDKPDVLRRFEEAYNHSVSSYKKFEGSGAQYFKWQHEKDSSG